MYSEIEKRVAEREKRKLVRSAGYRNVDTGKKKRVTVVEADGSETEILEPVVERVFTDATYEKALEQEDVWVITETETKEQHEFTSLQAAENFLREVN